MVRIIPDGRTDIDDYFKLSGVLDSEELNHTPLLAFIASEDTVNVRIVHKPAELLSFPDETPVMGQWRGEWRSDFFQFTVGQLRRYFEAKYEPLKSARNAVKIVGPRGGFRSLSYEYTDERGIRVHSSTSSKAEAQRLELFFARYNIPITVRKSR
jgi:hypothetical protein